MNALSERLVRLIEAQGPISIAQYMTLALHDPVHGYYATHHPIGADGDFITAPEVSQMFGELLGLWCVQCWRDQGSPSPARLVELGPGRGTLMADVLRAARIAPEFLSAIEIVLIETSARLRDAQASNLKRSLSPSGGEGRGLPRRSCEAAKPGEGALPPVRWSNTFNDSLTDRPLFLLANEFFDALPVRQFVYTDRGWSERMVGLDDRRNPTFALSPMPVTLEVRSERGSPNIGEVYEASLSGEAIVEQIGRAIAAHGGAALIVDYGYGSEAGFGETLQAVEQHKFARVLENPGEADLSAHVDFSALSRAAERGGAKAYGPLEQGVFLDRLGIEERSRRLAQGNPKQARDIAAAVERLTAAAQMGALFKALAITPKNAPAPAGL